jgi:GGDEF domain-containing protein
MKPPATPDSTPRLPELLLEDALNLLRVLVMLAWVGVAAMVCTQLWIRQSPDFAWPALGGFPATYNGMLVEFGLTTLMLTMLLVVRDWYERVPRQSAHRVNWLLTAVIVWFGLHLFTAFHVTGSLRGPLLPLLPLLMMAALVVLPGRAGWLAAGYFAAGFASVPVLESRGVLLPVGLLADAFSYSRPATPPGIVALLLVLAGAALLGAGLRRHTRTLRNSRLDSATGLFHHAFLEQRIGAELARARRQGGCASLLLLRLEGLSAQDAFTDSHLRQLGQRLLTQIRLHSDTPARYGLATLAVLLPTSTAEGVQGVTRRLLDTFSETKDVAYRLRAGAVVVNDPAAASVASVLNAAEIALAQAGSSDEASVVTVGKVQASSPPNPS